MTNDVDEVLRELEAEKLAKDSEQEALREKLTPDGETLEETARQRREKVDGFKLAVDWDAAAQEEPEPEPVPPPLVNEPAPVPEKAPVRRKKKKKKKNRFFGGMLYVLIVILVSVVLAGVVLISVLDISGVSKSDKAVSVTIPEGATTQKVAEVLHEKGLIDYPLVFRLYSRLTGADGTFHPHEDLDLTPDMGYAAIISALQELRARETVSVTVPEGKTVREIAKLLEENRVCSASDFLDAVVNGDYSEFSFVTAIPTAQTDPRYKNRVYALEGYLFPDTYEFNVESAADTVVRKMLKNFQSRLGTSLLAKIQARGLTVDQAVILASVIQGEVNNERDMYRVSRVLYNRLAPGSSLPKLQCDSTQLYLKGLMGGSYDNQSELAQNYDTYQMTGLPVGAIGNPGLNALMAAVQPSSEPVMAKCYYFVTDTSTGVTYYSETFSEHQQHCREIFH